MRSAPTLRVVLFSAIWAGLLGLGACVASPKTEPDPPLREFRGVFVTTAYNLDWPSRPGLHRKVQIDEIRAVVNRAKELNCNVIFLQVRAFGDRIHRKTKIKPPEPWSAALNNWNDPDPRDPDKVPEAQKYDPLREWILECHKAGIELHAWINPFRVNSLVTIDGRKPFTLPVRATEDGYYMLLDPTNRHVQDHVLKVIAELLDYEVTSPNPGKLHGVDGVLFDHNWGYPPPKGEPTQPAGLDGADASSGREAAEPAAAKALSAANRKKARIKWLLKKAAEQPPEPSAPVSVDTFIENVSKTVQGKGVKFGFSPGLEDNSVNQRLNAKVKQWLNEYRLNYVVPELYHADDAEHPFQKTLEEWLAAVPTRDARQGFTPIVVAGLFTTRVQTPEADSNGPWPAGEIVGQVAKTRSAQDKKAKPWGQAHYSWSALRSPGHGGPEESNNVGERLKKGLYAEAALIPECTAPPRRSSPPPPPEVELKPQGRHKTATWKHARPEPEVCCWAVWLYENDRWGPMQVFGRSTDRLDVPATVDRVAVKAIDRYNRESGFGTSP